MMRDNDTKLLQEALSDVFRAVAKDGNFGEFAKSGEKQKTCKDGYFWCPEDKECKKEEPKNEAAELGDTYEERGQRMEGRGLLKALSAWIETARGDELKNGYELILKAYQTAGYPDAGDDERVERDDDYRGEDPSPRETDQDRYGYPGDR